MAPEAFPRLTASGSAFHRKQWPAAPAGGRSGVCECRQTPNASPSPSRMIDSGYSDESESSESSESS